MSTQQEQIASVLEELLKTPVDDLTRTSELGTEGGFEKYRPDIEELLRYLSKLSQVTFDGVPTTTVTQIFNQLNQIKNVFTEIRSYNPVEIQKKNQNIYQIRDQIGVKIAKCAQNLFTQSSHVLAISRTEGSELSKLRKDLVDATKQIKGLQAEAQKASKSAQAAAGQTGIARHSAIFMDEATNKNDSNYWLAATILLIITTLCWGFFSIFISPETAINYAYSKELVDLSSEMAKYYILQLTIGKFVILSILTFATTWCAKNYSSHRHNYVINIHRHNALNTFETFASAADSDNQVKNAVLLQATQTIFQHQSSGYSKSESQGNESSHILEITKSIPTSLSK